MHSSIALVSGPYLRFSSCAYQMQPSGATLSAHAVQDYPIDNPLDGRAPARNWFPNHGEPRGHELLFVAEQSCLHLSGSHNTFELSYRSTQLQHAKNLCLAHFCHGGRALRALTASLP